MSAFFVGQRVRLVRPGIAKHMGHTGRIKELFPTVFGGSYPVNCDIDLDERPDRGFNSFTHTDRLEPIVPEGMQPAKWEDCLWQPEGVAA